MHIPRLISKQIGRFMSEKKLFQSSHPTFLPFYHSISNTPPPHILNYRIFDEKAFEAHLDYYLRYFKPITLEELVHNPSRNTKQFHLSFDDGLKECEEVIAPILLRKGVPATFFINSGFVDNNEMFHRYKASLILRELKSHPDSETEGFLKRHNIDRENLLQTPFSKRGVLDEATDMLRIDMGSYLQKHQPYLSSEQIINLDSKGFSIGGHSHKHPEFWKISPKKQQKHVRKSMAWIERNVPQKIKAFAFPYTDDGVSEEFIQNLHEQNICDITFGTAGLKYDSVRTHFQRYAVEQEGDFYENLKTEFVYFKLRKGIGKATVKH